MQTSVTVVLHGILRHLEDMYTQAHKRLQHCEFLMQLPLWKQKGGNQSFSKFALAHVSKHSLNAVVHTSKHSFHVYKFASSTEMRSCLVKRYVYLLTENQLCLWLNANVYGTEFY